MQVSVKQLLFNNKSLKVISLILGYLLWSILGNSITSTIWLQVPVCFYNDNNIKIEAPETIWVQLTGKRASLYTVDNNNLAIVIDAEKLKLGNNNYIVTNENLFLSPAITLCDYKPHRVVIKVTKIQ